MAGPDLVTGLLWFLAFLFSTTVHEAMHAWGRAAAAIRPRITAGKVSLSPIPHIKREPIGMLVVPLVTALSQGWAIGWASTPYRSEMGRDDIRTAPRSWRWRLRSGTSSSRSRRSSC